MTSQLSDLPPSNYPELLGLIKQRIRQGQTRAALAANAELIMLYWDIGKMLHGRQQHEGWGAAVIPRLARDIRNELPEIKGFSERNIKRMLAFFREYQELAPIVPQSVAQNEPAVIVPQLVAQIPAELLWQIPWGHNILLIEKVKDIKVRKWYMEQIPRQGWSRDVLQLMIRNRAHERQGKAVTNFEDRLPPPHSELMQQTLKDPYIFDFLTLEEPFHERELETGLIRHLERFLLELGQGFAFVGRQYHLDIGEEDFYIDLLFYHLRLRCFVAVELKKGSFRPEYAGKMNFYCNVVDDRLRHESDSPTIGLILCQDKKTVLAEYTLRGVDKPIGVSEYELTRALPENLRSALPAIEEIERELSEDGDESSFEVNPARSPDEKQAVLDIVNRYARTWQLLLQYDEDNLQVPADKHETRTGIDLDQARRAIAALKKELLAKGEATDIFGHERGHGLAGIIGAVHQTFGGQELYPSVEEKAAHLLYFVIKDHPFTDGNKRIGSFLFLLFLQANGLLDGGRYFDNRALVSLALLTAASEPGQKEVLIRLIMNLITTDSESR